MSRSLVSLWYLSAIVLVGLNLRPALASIGPLLDALQTGAGLGDGLASLLTSLPVLLMGLATFGGLAFLIGGAVWLGLRRRTAPVSGPLPAG